MTTDILYPPEFVFPNNPNILSSIKPQIIEEVYKEDNSELQFLNGFNGSMTIIKTKFAPYIDIKKYDYINRKWIGEPPIVVTILGNEEINDVTDYFSTNTINLSENTLAINDKINYYFDGEKIVTSYSFTNVEDRKRVVVRYSKMIESIIVKAVLRTNVSSLSDYTPIIDQYTLLLNKQKVIS